MQALARRWLSFFLILSAAILAFFAFVGWSPAASLDELYTLGPATNEISLVVSVSLMWLLVGFALWWLSFRRVTQETALLFAGAIAVSLVYLAFLREHVQFMDYRAFVQAARTMLAGQPLPERYIYPPLWAFSLSLLQRAFGEQAPALACFATTHISLVAFYVLGVLLLARCGVSRTLASLLMFAAVVVNVPILRNVVYVQVNLLLIDLVLAGLLVMRRSTLLSALFFALATHLKIVPVLFVPVFIYRKEYRWLAYYVVLCVVIAWLAPFGGGFAYFRDFVGNLGQWHPARLRSCSFYGLFHNTDRIFELGLPVDALFNVVRAVLGVWIYAVSYISIRRETFSRSDDLRTSAAINGLMPLMFLMPAFSPAAWSYHQVLLILPAVLTLLYLRGPRRLGLWSIGYFFTFLLPVFDLYPWSYLRLVGWVALLVALTDAVLRPRTSRWLENIDEAVNAGLSAATAAVSSASRRRFLGE